MDRTGGPPIGLNRTGKSCRLRWVNYLHPGLKRGRMTPEEEHLVLQLHAKLGNRWSKIAQRLPGRTDNEIKNYWRTHMRKEAQERKMMMSSVPPSPSSSSSSNISSSVNENPAELLGTQKNNIEVGTVAEGSSLISGFGSNEEEGMKVYTMDQIWNEIAASDIVSFNGEYNKDGACNISSSPMNSPIWEGCSESLWRIDDEELKKLITPMPNLMSQTISVMELFKKEAKL